MDNPQNNGEKAASDARLLQSLTSIAYSRILDLYTRMRRSSHPLPRAPMLGQIKDLCTECERIRDLCQIGERVENPHETTLNIEGPMPPVVMLRMGRDQWVPLMIGEPIASCSPEVIRMILEKLLDTGTAILRHAFVP